MKISICTPTHDIPERSFFLKRIEKSLEEQSFQDFEWVITDEGKMAENSNAAIKKAKGEIIKMLYMDDYLAAHDSLKKIADNFEKGWLATGCIHDNGVNRFSPHMPEFDERIGQGINTIGSPSVVAFENDAPLLFDEKLSWMLDIDLYKRLYERYGAPTLLMEINVVIGIGAHQMTNKLTDAEKQEEVNYVANKYQ